MAKPKSIGVPGGSSNTTCGYCGPPGGRSGSPTNCYSATLDTDSLSCVDYQKMIDRGWRRSGTYCYKPDLRRSCCPQYTIKLDALEFKPSKSQRKQINRWNRHVIYGRKGDQMHVDGKHSVSTTSLKPAKNVTFSLRDSLHSSEASFVSEVGMHRFEVTLEPSSYSHEKFNLFKKYQVEIHHDERNSSYGFKHFLVESPLVVEPIPYSTPPPENFPEHYGSYHQLYRLDGELIAMGVLDILPRCISSVYFMYDQRWEEFSLGKLSALREISLAQEIHDAGVLDMQYLYMGFYIHSCQKMRYKGEYSPSYLVDPETYEWYPLEECKRLLERYRYACFAFPEHSLSGPPDDDDATETSLNLSTDDIVGVHIFSRSSDGRAIRIPISAIRYDGNEGIYQCIYGLGSELAKDVVLRVM
ncbi:arginine-tRNA-protein transferase [Cyathus striatus]|nr:arginine-tRNA-protein transferase [Cyathus striatus]